MEGLEEQLALYSFLVTGFGIALLFGFSLLALLIKHPSAFIKRILFGSILIVTIFPTVYLAGSTIYLNSISESHGPVHWHADFEIWACGEEINLRDPRGFSNKIGTATLHEHNDNRIHLEGVVIKPTDASLGKFFAVLGGSLTRDTLQVPVADRMLSLVSGMSCGRGTMGYLQVFVYKTDTAGYFRQEKLADPSTYIISPYSNVPSGDCIIVDVDKPKERTDKLCVSYKAAEKTGKLKGERQ